MSPNLKVLHTKHAIEDLQQQTWHSTKTYEPWIRAVQPTDWLQFSTNEH